MCSTSTSPWASSSSCSGGGVDCTSLPSFNSLASDHAAFHQRRDAALYSLALMTMARCMYVATSSTPPGRPTSDSCVGMPNPPSVTPLAAELLYVGLASSGDWWTSGLSKLIVRLISLSESWLRAEGVEARYGDSLVRQPIQSMLASNAGLHTRGLFCRKNERFRKT